MDISLSVLYNHMLSNTNRSRQSTKVRPTFPTRFQLQLPKCNASSAPCSRADVQTQEANDSQGKGKDTYEDYWFAVFRYRSFKVSGFSGAELRKAKPWTAKQRKEKQSRAKQHKQQHKRQQHNATQSISPTIQAQQNKWKEEQNKRSTATNE